MVKLVDQHQSELAALCRQYDVKRLELFGSALVRVDEADVHDLDFLVEFSDWKTEGAADRFFGLMFGLEELFDKPVDLVHVSAIKNPYFRDNVMRQCKVIYESEKQKRAV